MLYQIERLNSELRRLFGVGLIVTSGIRTYEEQVKIFLERYVVASQVRGRRVYDTRVWNGVRYYRISSAGTVAVPRTSNHEIQGTKAAVDIRDTGSDAGITSRNSVRGRWFRANAANFDMQQTGDAFGEGWHVDTFNIFNRVPGGSSGSNITRKEEDMLQSVHINGKIYGMAPEFLKHYLNVAESTITRQVTSASDEEHNLNKGVTPQVALEKFVALLNGLGIPQDVLDKNGFVKNPQSGLFENGGVWSRERENAARLDRIEKLLATK
jgi:hypothetical protein